MKYYAIASYLLRIFSIKLHRLSLHGDYDALLHRFVPKLDTVKPEIIIQFAMLCSTYFILFF